MKKINPKTLKKAYSLPTPKIWRFVGDSLLIIGSSLTGYEIMMGNHTLAIIMLVCTILGKILTNFANILEKENEVKQE